MDNGRRGFLKGLAAFAAAAAVGGSIKLESDEDYEKLDKEWQKLSEEYKKMVDENPVSIKISDRSDKQDTVWIWSQEMRGYPMIAKFVPPAEYGWPKGKEIWKQIDIDDAAWTYYLTIDKFFTESFGHKAMIKNLKKPGYDISIRQDVMIAMNALNRILQSYTWDLYHANHWTLAIGRGYLLWAYIDEQNCKEHIDSAVSWFQKLGCPNPSEKYSSAVSKIYEDFQKDLEIKYNKKPSYPEGFIPDKWKKDGVLPWDKQSVATFGKPWLVNSVWINKVTKSFMILKLDKPKFEYTHENGLIYKYVDRGKANFEIENTAYYEATNFVSGQKFRSFAPLKQWGQEIEFDFSIFNEMNVFTEKVKGEYDKKSKKWIPKSA